jgi:hypothetical protein
MSYEGYVQYLCKNGHYWTVDAYDDYESTCPDCCCPDCRERPYWENCVDETNGSYCDCQNGEGCEHCVDGRIDGYIELEEDTPAEYETCECCGATKTIKQRTYKIPQGKGQVLNDDD